MYSIFLKKDLINGENSLKKYNNTDPSFVDSLYSDFLNEAIQAIKCDNLQSFKTAVTKLHKSNNLDTWSITIFSLIHNKLTGAKPNDNYMISDPNTEINWQ